MSILITGGTGYVGQNLIKELLNLNYKVIALVRNIKRAQNILHPHTSKLKYVEADLFSINQIINELITEKVSIVIHLAAEMDFYPKDISKIYRVNVEGTSSLLKSCKIANKSTNNQIIRFIYCSSTETIGPTDGDEPGTEETPCSPSYHYGKSKIQAEERVKQFAEKSNIFSLILRPTGIYGPGDRFTIWELQKMVEWGLLFFIPGSGNAKLMYTHIDDVVQSFLLSVALPKDRENSIREKNDGKFYETFIICPNDVLTYKQWIVLLSQEMGRAVPFLHLPFPMVKLSTALLAPFMNLGKTRTFMYQPKTIDRMAENRFYSNNRAKQMLDFVPKYSLRDGLIQTVRFNVSQKVIRKWPLSPFLVLSILAFAFVVAAIFPFVFFANAW